MPSPLGRQLLALPLTPLSWCPAPSRRSTQELDPTHSGTHGVKAGGPLPPLLPPGGGGALGRAPCTGNTAEPTGPVSRRHSGHGLFLSPPKLKSASSPHTAIPPRPREPRLLPDRGAGQGGSPEPPWEGNAHPRGQKELIHQPAESPCSPGSMAMKCL